MAQSTTLDSFIGSPYEGVSEEKASGKIAFKPPEPDSLPPSYLLSVDYDGNRRLAFAKLYEPKTHTIHVWYDKTSHKPYCLSDKGVEELQRIDAVARNPGFDHFEEAVKYDALRDRMVKMTKIVAKDPLTIGGKPTGSIRDAIKSWEADIKYFENYIYDMGLEPGMLYEIVNGQLRQVEFKPPKDDLDKLDEMLKHEDEEHRALAREWLRLLECPVPTYRRAAIDIEVYQPIPTRMPDPREAMNEVICASIVGSDGTKQVLLLRRPHIEEGTAQLPADAGLKYYDDEKELLRDLFRALFKYPLVITFNGDDFDLNYLYHRAKRLGFPDEEVPILMGRDEAKLKYGIHIDLYKFFFNRSIQVYAFGQKYRENTLDDVGEALLGYGKLEIDGNVSELSYRELAAYCLRDAEIVMALTSFDDDLVMKLMTALSRISYMPIDAMSRLGVSWWIRSLLFKYHRKLGYLIPRQDDILGLKGRETLSTKAVIKGKKYKGAIVVEPKPGAHFNVAVLDFASLYPSTIKLYNLGYETVRCPHEECKSNIVPGTGHWVCTKRRALESLIIGSLRDVRVKWFKSRSKLKDLPAPVRSWYKVVSDGLKVVLNASYGVFGAEIFALYTPPVAEATAAIGRYIIESTIKRAEELNIEVFYGDTDSIFLGSTKPELLQELIAWAFSELKMELELDKQYRYVALSSRKKNYLGVFHDGRVDIKGLTGKKRHVPEFLKKAFYEVVHTLSQVRSPEEFEEARKSIGEIAKDVFVKLKTRAYPLEELAFSVMLSRSPGGYTKTTPQHVKAARLLADRGIEVKAGDLISFVKVITEPGVKPVELATVEEVDVEKYLEYVRSTFEQVLDALDIDFEELIGTKRLETFLG